MKRLCFGPRRERLTEAPGQQHLFDTDGTASVAAELADLLPAEEPTERKRKKGHGRRQIPAHLPRTEVPHDVPGEARVCECGREKVRIGEDVTEQLDLEPAKMTVYRHVYPKYACPCCKNGVTSAPPAPSPIARGMAGPELLAYIFVNKFAIHLPTYRQPDMLTPPWLIRRTQHTLRLACSMCPGAESSGRLDARASAHVAGPQRR